MCKSKYHSRKTVVDGITFDSKREADRYKELRAWEKAGVISGLTRQQAFTLIPAQRIDGKVVERAVKYVADFCYYRDGEYVVEDVKGFRTPEYKLKRKMLLWAHGIQIKEV